MRNKIFSILPATPVLFIFIVCSCGKPEPFAREEEDLRVTIDAINNAEVLGPNYSFNLTIESVMPPSGVGVSVIVVGESDNRNYSPIPDFETSNKISSIGLHDLPAQTYCICTIRVTSKTKNTNSKIVSFRIIRK
jgi:hypothetical protein